MNIKPTSVGDFINTLTDRGVPTEKLDEAIKSVLAQHKLKDVREVVGKSLNLPDTFESQSCFTPRVRHAIGDLAPPTTDAVEHGPQGGRSMGALGIHAFAGEGASAGVGDSTPALGSTTPVWQRLFESGRLLGRPVPQEERFADADITQAARVFDEVARLIADELPGKPRALGVLGHVFNQNRSGNPALELWNVLMIPVGIAATIVDATVSAAVPSYQPFDTHVRQSTAEQLAERHAAADPVEQAVIAALAKFWIETSAAGKATLKDVVSPEALPILQELHDALPAAAQVLLPAAQRLVETGYLARADSYQPLLDVGNGGFWSGPSSTGYGRGSSRLESAAALEERTRYRYTLSDTAPGAA